MATFTIKTRESRWVEYEHLVEAESPAEAVTKATDGESAIIKTTIEPVEKFGGRILEVTQHSEYDKAYQSVHRHIKSIGEQLDPDDFWMLLCTLNSDIHFHLTGEETL